MRKAVIPKVSSTSADADDWETDPDFVNDVNEEQQRWGASSRTVGAIDMSALREATKQEDQQCKNKLLEEGPNAAYGYGGKFGVQADRMDKSAVGHEHIEQISKHASQKDYATGFGGKYGVQADRVDKSAVGWDHKENLQKHASQKDYSTGFGGKFGVQTDRIDKSAVGWDHKENVAKHASQTDYATGFGGKYGVQTDRVDKAAVGWDHKENMSKHASQKDYAAGFGGKFGVQTDRVDKAAVGWDHKETVPKHASQIDHSMGFGGKYGVQSDRMDSSAKGWEDGEGSDRLRARKTSSSQPDEVKEAEQKASQLKQRFEQMAISNAEQAQSKPLPKKLPTAAKAPVQQPTPPPAQVDPIPQNIPRVEDTEQQTRDEPVLTRVSIQDTPLLAPEVNEIPQDSEVTPEDAWQETQEWEEEGQAGDVYENVGEDAGLVAIALYDYQAAAEDELSFDPDDVITNIEMIDEGWWRGELNGKCGLFPANYVTLQNQ